MLIVQDQISISQRYFLEKYIFYQTVYIKDQTAPSVQSDFDPHSQ